MGNFRLFHCQSMGVTLRLRAWSCQLDWKKLKPHHSDCSRMQGVMSCLCVRTAAELKELPFRLYDHHCHQYLPSCWKVLKSTSYRHSRHNSRCVREEDFEVPRKNLRGEKKKKKSFLGEPSDQFVTGNPWENWKSWRHRMVIEWSRTWSPKLRMTRNQCLGRDHVPSVECDTFDTLESKEIWKRRQKASGPRDVAWQKTIPRVPSRRSDTTWQNSTTSRSNATENATNLTNTTEFRPEWLRMPQNPQFLMKFWWLISPTTQTWIVSWCFMYKNVWVSD